MQAKKLFLLPMLAVLFGCNRQVEPGLFISGRIDGDTVDISSKIAGRIVDLKVREGDTVQAGQIVAWLSSPQEEANRDAQKARIEQLQRQLATYDERVRQAQIEYDQVDSREIRSDAGQQLRCALDGEGRVPRAQ